MLAKMMEAVITYLPKPNPSFEPEKSVYGPYVPLAQLKEALKTGTGEIPSNPIRMEEAYEKLANKKPKPKKKRDGKKKKK